MPSASMKILYIAPERDAAVLAARVLHGTGPNVALTWAQSPAAALQWLQSNRDPAAIIVEVLAQNCASLVEQIRSQHPTTPIVVVAGGGQLEPVAAALNAGADGYVVAGESFKTDLPRIIALAMKREHGRRELLTRTLSEFEAARDDAERRLTLAEQVRQQTEQRAASELAAAAARLADVQARHTASLGRESRICTALQQRLFELETSLRNADERRASDAAAFADQLAKRHAEFTASLTQTAQTRDALAAQLSIATAALNDAQQARRVEAATAEALRSREAELAGALEETGAARTSLERALADEKAAHRAALERADIDLASANERQAALEDLLNQESDRRRALEQKLANSDAEYQEADRRHEAELTRANARLADIQARYDAALAENAAARAEFDRRAAEAASALDRAMQERASDAAAAADELARRETEIRADLAGAAAARTVLECALADAQAAHQREVQRAAADLSSARECQATLEDRLAREGETGKSLERQLLLAESGRLDADRRHAAELAVWGGLFALIHAQHDATLTEHARARAVLEQQVADAATEYQQASQRAADIQQEAAAREAELVDRLARESGARVALEGDLAAARTESGRGRRRSLHVASAYRRRVREQKLTWEAQLAAREAELIDRLARESSARVALERDLAAARTESGRGRRRSLHVASAYRRRVREQTLTREAQLAAERAASDRAVRTKEEEIRQVQLEHETLRHLLATTQDQLRDLQGIIADERQTYERSRLASEVDLQRLSAEYGQLRQSFDALQAAFQTLERVAGEHAAERARLESVVGDRDTELHAQAERHRIADEAAQDALAGLQQTLRRAAEASGSETARLHGEIDTLRRELDGGRIGAESLRQDLQAQLEQSQRERRREFERAPYAMCRCTDGGVITDANHTFVRLFGRRRVDELRNMDFGALVSDCAGDVGWLLERARTTGQTQTVEANWATRDGGHRVVRLQALATTSGSVDIVVEDITEVRVLEDRIRQAQRMEAVGRLSSEVAVTCEALLRDVAAGAHRWLAAAGGDDVLRRESELLLAELARAERSLRQLTAYGHEQVRALEPVNAQRVLRDLAPVLKHIVGDQIELAMSKSSGSSVVDVKAERLERILVTVAGYARDRMPWGGQIRIDLATTTVGRRLVAQHPNVRPGAHVLITVTELPKRLRGDTEGRSPSADKAGLDVSGLMELVGTCGGHLWMEAQPAGNMVVKIHLPKRSATDGSESKESGSRSDRAGRLARLFRFTSGSVVRG